MGIGPGKSALHDVRPERRLYAPVGTFSGQVVVSALLVLPLFSFLIRALLLRSLLELLHQALHFNRESFRMTLDINGPGAEIEWHPPHNSAFRR